MIDPITGWLMVSGLISGAYGAYQNWQNQKDINEANIRANREQYEREQKAANENWSLANAYNSPMQQMTRLRQAGLNPNLVYGRGADNTAGSIQTIQKSMPTQTAPRLELDKLSGMANEYANLKAVAAQTENTQQATMTAKANEELTKMNVAKVATETARSKFDLEQAKQLKNSVIEGARLDNMMKYTTINVTLNRDQREQMANSKNLQKTTQDILESEQRVLYQKMLMENNPKQQQYLQKQIDMMSVAIQNAKHDGTYKAWVARLADMGMSPSDPYAVRLLSSPMAGRIVNTIVEKTKQKGKPTFQPNKFDDPSRTWNIGAKY